MCPRQHCAYQHRDLRPVHTSERWLVAELKRTKYMPFIHHSNLANVQMQPGVHLQGHGSLHRRA